MDRDTIRLVLEAALTAGVIEIKDSIVNEFDIDATLDVIDEEATDEELEHYV